LAGRKRRAPDTATSRAGRLWACVTATLACIFGRHDWDEPERPTFLDIRWCVNCTATEQWRESDDGKSASWHRIECGGAP